MTEAAAESPAPAPALASEDGLRPFARGGLAGVLGWLVIHPADVIKVRLQVSGASESTTAVRYAGPFDAARRVAATEGLSGLYAGLTAALTRQVTYTTLRLGLYGSLRERIASDGASPTLREKLLLGLVAGGVASAVSTPVEVCQVRMYADGSASPANKRGYRHIGDALLRVGREEGVRGLWAGATPTIARSCVANAVQLGVYDQAKETYKQRVGMRDGVGLHFAASLTSGYCYSLATLPIDLAKTRFQNQRAAKDGAMPYRNIAQTMVKIATEESFFSLWKGFVPYFARCGGHTIAM